MRIDRINHVIKNAAYYIFVGAGIYFTNNSPVFSRQYSDSAFYSQVTGNFSEQRLFALIDTLSSAHFEGRGTGEKGMKQASNFIAEQFRQNGLSPISGKKTYLQKFPIKINLFDKTPKLMIHTSTRVDTLILGNDFLPAALSGSGNLKKVKTVFAGYGIESGEKQWFDYRNINSKDKLVIVLDGTPKIEGIKWNDEGHLFSKIETAIQKQVSGLIVIKDNLVGAVRPFRIDGFPVFFLKRESAIRIVKSLSPDRYKEAMTKSKTSIESFELDEKYSLFVKTHLEQTNGINVIGILEGQDEILKNEYLLLTAHYDHLGMLGDSIYYGANDNASGTSALLTIAHTFNRLNLPFKRSIVFVAFSGEELGLIGSRYFVNNPSIPLGKIKFVLNLDMLASGAEGVMVVCGKTFPHFFSFLEKINNNTVKVNLKKRPQAANSDHYYFVEKGVPAFFFYAIGGKQPYHSFQDVYPTIDREIYKVNTKLAALFTAALAKVNPENFPKP